MVCLELGAYLMTHFTDSSGESIKGAYHTLKILKPGEESLFERVHVYRTKRYKMEFYTYQ